MACLTSSISGSAGDPTGVLLASSAGEGVSGALLDMVYGELRALAESCLRGERPGHTLQATALVHEAYLKLIDQRRVNWRNRAHFFSVAAMVMRRILVDHARAKRSEKRGGDAQQVLLCDAAPIVGRGRDNLDLLALDEALERLASIAPTEASVVQMRYFAGLSESDIALVLGVTDRTVRRHWNHAKAWLFREISKGDTRFDQTGRSAS